MGCYNLTSFMVFIRIMRNRRIFRIFRKVANNLISAQKNENNLMLFTAVKIMLKCEGNLPVGLSVEQDVVLSLSQRETACCHI